jgi:opacity protein-like surface antigen
MNRNSIVLAGAICTLLGVGHAAPANAQFLDSVGGTYLRGDLGWSWAKDAELVDKNFGLDGFIFDSAGTGPGVVNDIGSSYVLGIGMGMRLAPQFRGDIVYSYRGGYELDDTDQFGDSFSGDVTSHSVMANVYWDIPYTISGFSPFVGGGIGWAGNKMKDVSTADGGSFILPEGEVSNFAWQAMAGLSMPISTQATVDVFYRYFDGGKLQIEEGTALFDDGTSAGTYTGARGQLQAHELMLSLRWTLGQ